MQRQDANGIKIGHSQGKRGAAVQQEPPQSLRETEKPCSGPRARCLDGAKQDSRIQSFGLWQHRDERSRLSAGESKNEDMRTTRALKRLRDVGRPHRSGCLRALEKRGGGPREREELDERERERE